MNKEQYKKIKKTFEKGFKHWDIKLPENPFLEAIQVGKQGWNIMAICNEDNLEYVSHHRMTSSCHEKIDLDGNLDDGNEGFGATMIQMAASQEEYTELRSKFLEEQENLYKRFKENGLADFPWWTVPNEKWYTTEERQAGMIEFAEKLKALKNRNRQNPEESDNA